MKTYVKSALIASTLVVAGVAGIALADATMGDGAHKGMRHGAHMGMHHQPVDIAKLLNLDATRSAQDQHGFSGLELPPIQQRVV